MDRFVAGVGGGGPVGRGGERRALWQRGAVLLADAERVRAGHGQAVERVRGYAAALRGEAVGRALDAMPVARLRDVTEGRLRVAPLEAAGFVTVGRVHRAEVYELLRVPGVGRTSAEQAKAAAAQLARAARENTAVRIDPDDRSDAATALVLELYPLVAAGPGLAAARARAEESVGVLEPLLAAARPARGGLRLLLTRRERREAALAASEQLGDVLRAAADEGLTEAFAQAQADLLRGPGSVDYAWLEFSTRAAEFYTVLGQLAELGPQDRASAEGHLPEGLAAEVHRQGLDTSLLRVSLRGYQAFGARYALARRRVVLGDEMGLGKTVQALAALAHLAAVGEGQHFLVVCPASVLVNWLRETASRTGLHAFRLHGGERATEADAWRRLGGVAVTTFEGLRRLDAAAVPVAMLVVDEAHYVKNPEAQRSRSVRELTDRCERVLFLSGTPMENRVGEFRALLGYLQPELLPEVRDLDAVAGAAGAAGAAGFRRAVAPAYLRRNQDDVLTELPEAVHTDDWQEFTASDEEAYREAVLSGNFQAMRRAAYARPEKSAKLRRLVELAAEAAQAGEKVLVFSFYREVLGGVAVALGQVPGLAVFGPVSGSTGAGARQDVVDDFTAHSGPAVLLAQIQAGGVGLNLQAANVVVLCEPQVKPALEEQAIARAHRMGQTRRVRVHRLLTPDSVDQRLLALLGRKQRLFDAYARRSEAAETSPEALDVSDQSLARQIVEEEQLRLAAARLG
ncbi:DEAD/DEAH box helicase [Streptacidiphilus monticola]|uniref:DEAD/DEAH box helicase n=1 Tax=Streptacidiphilus monticola TaxID=2161674 RepID=A0ABW1FZ98_9ACTN